MNTSLATDYFTRIQEDLGVTLNEIQKQAVTQTEGAVLLLASPGSGKTTTLLMRIGYLVHELGTHPSRIKAVTFSRASAVEMKERYVRYFPGQKSQVQFSTIHSLSFEIVREYYGNQPDSFLIIEGGADAPKEGAVRNDARNASAATGHAVQPPLYKQAILRHLYKSLTGEPLTDDQMEELTTYISYVKNKMLSEDEWGTVKISIPQAEGLLREYERFKRSGHSCLLVDYDDMLTMANDLLARNPALLAVYQGRYDYLLTDESQDTSLVQHDILAKLAQRHGNLFVVADDDQSIYSWRGAEPGYLLNFREQYPAAKVLFMEQNYRSVPVIVDTANQFIRRNKQRYDKNMFTDNQDEGTVRIHTAADSRAQTAYLIEALRSVDRDKLADTAILYRNNASSIAVIHALDHAGIPFYMKDTDNRFFSHWVVEDILNFMRMTFTDKRPDLLSKIHLKMNGYISKQQMAELLGIENQEPVFDNLLHHVSLKDYQIKPLETVRDTFREMSGMPPLPAIRVIRERLGYDKGLDRLCEWQGHRKEHMVEILNTLEEIAETQETMTAFAARLKTLEAALKTSKRRKEDVPAVTLSTFHSAKGLEFDQVYMIDLMDGIIPSSEDLKAYASGNESPLEEAVRLFYVGMTRAKFHLELIFCRERGGEKTSESRFVSHVRSLVKPEHTITSDGSARTVALQAGDGVRHHSFGMGEVIGMNGDLIDIRFGQDIRTLSLRVCLEMELLEVLSME
ncbi:ATP-dependent helicase [Paenibacillus brevis]|uniref:DNA 3'-5' helicase n=1 Tax=Paenibacillus brevis TaxID=2841508 RepID=A0ABS6FN88_9BACL|nr:ATP-dependent helicase [Paenibacillus brevis]MBU5671682.1 ATP-dependent helicase [Paenibacillus brevis]